MTKYKEIKTEDIELQGTQIPFLLFKFISKIDS